ncbi:MAG: hypothetical protein HWE27_10595 [Gammaproteobacteria bacterium]|nr:hypothetical protein [Gammaproteobacteria bacterium]
MKKLLLSCFIFFSMTVSAWDHESGSFTVSSLRFGAGVVYVALSPAPAGCEGGNQYRMHLKVNDTDPQAYKDMVAGLLSAHATGQRIRSIWNSNKGKCDAQNILRLDMFEFAPK